MDARPLAIAGWLVTLSALLPPRVAGSFMRCRMAGMGAAIEIGLISLSLIMGACLLYSMFAGTTLIFGGRKGFPLSDPGKFAFSIFLIGGAVGTIFANTIVAIICFAVMVLSFFIGNWIAYLDKIHWEESQRKRPWD